MNRPGRLAGLCDDVQMAYPPSVADEAYAAEELDAALRKLASDLRGGLTDSVERGMAQQREEVPTCFATPKDPDAEALIADGYGAVLGFVYDGLEGSWGLPQREAPEPAAEDTRVSADRGVDLGVLTQSYRIAHRLLFEEVMEKVTGRIADRDLRRVLLRVTNQSIFADFDWITARMIETYEHERLLLARDEEWFTRRLIRDLLESDGEDLETTRLDYDVSGPHLALVAWGPEAWRLPEAIGDRLGVPLLSVSGTPATTWAWLGAADIDRNDSKLLDALQAAPAARVAFGDPARGIDGFRVSHRQAWGAYRMARDTDAHVTWYSDVALLVLTLQDPDAARQFALSELGPLAEDEPRSQVLRETLSVYFRCGHNGASAAAALGIHDRTVLYRIRAIEDGLGRSVTARREELALALRLAPVVLDRRRIAAR